jgi:hypothetical protein
MTTRLAGHGVAGPVRFQNEYRLTEDGTATILTQSIRAIPRGPFRLASGLLRRDPARLTPAGSPMPALGSASEPFGTLALSGAR